MKISLVSILVLVIFASFTYPVYADKTYSEPNLTTKHTKPDLYAKRGTSFARGNMTVTLPPDSIPYDAYIEYGRSQLSKTISVGKYWSQCGFVEKINIRDHFNDALVKPEKNGVISFSYRDCDLSVFPGFSFPETSLKLVYSPNNGESWFMMRNPVIDFQQKTIAYAVDFKNGGYMLMAGFVNPNTYYNHRSTVLGVSEADRLGGSAEDRTDGFTFSEKLSLLVQAIRFRIGL